MRGIKLFTRAYSTSSQGLTSLASSATKIRVWKSGYFNQNRQFIYSNPIYSIFVPYIKQDHEGNIGHVSIETKNIYASLWPNYLTVLNKLKIQNGDAIQSSPEIDENSEGRAPDHLVDLYTLDTKAIEQTLDDFVKSGKYHVIGNNILFNKRMAESCSSLAYKLLIKGGIKKLVPESDFVRDYLVVTPNHLGELIEIAKKNEQDVLSSTNDKKLRR